ncbi:MAG: hypothetical protein VYE68_15535 [Acidobacteriota bacterium]|nr:hypothetical protein [Acidobacteriota bacterium]
MSKTIPTDVRREIRRLYHETTEKTVERDLRHAIELLKHLDEADRVTVAGYMDGLSQLRSEWILAQRRSRGSRKKKKKPVNDE